MMRAHAPNARGGLPLATPGARRQRHPASAPKSAARPAFLDRVSVWRFLSLAARPAGSAVLVDRAGEQVCDESRYGAALGDAIIGRGGRAWLALVDHATRAQARRQVRGSTRCGSSACRPGYLAEPGRGPRSHRRPRLRPGHVDPDGLACHRSRLQRRQPRPGSARPGSLHHLQAHHLAAYFYPAAHHPAAHHPAAPGPAGKPAAARKPQDQPPYYLIDCSVRPRLFYPAPVLTSSAASRRRPRLPAKVLRADGRPVDGAAVRRGHRTAGRLPVCSLLRQRPVPGRLRLLRPPRRPPRRHRPCVGTLPLRRHRHETTRPVPAGLHTASLAARRGAQLPSVRRRELGWLNSPPLTPACRAAREGRPGQLRGPLLQHQPARASCPHVRAWAEKAVAARPGRDRRAHPGVRDFDARRAERPAKAVNTDSEDCTRTRSRSTTTTRYGARSTTTTGRRCTSPTRRGRSAITTTAKANTGSSPRWSSSRLLAEAGVRDAGIDVKVTPEAPGLEAPADWTRNLEITGELHRLRAHRELLASPGILVPDRPQVYDAPSQLRLNHWALAGDWTAGAQATTLNEIAAWPDRLPLPGPRPPPGHRTAGPGNRGALPGQDGRAAARRRPRR